MKRASYVAVIAWALAGLLSSPSVWAFSNVTWQVQGTLEDGRTFSGTVTHLMGDGADPDAFDVGLHYAYAYWGLQSWTVHVVSNDVSPTIDFLGTDASYSWDNAYYQRLNSGNPVQEIQLTNVDGDSLTLSFVGVFSQFMVATPFGAPASFISGYLDGTYAATVTDATVGPVADTRVNVQITSFQQGGLMCFEGLRVGTTCTVQWVSSISDPTRTNWHNLDPVIVTGACTTVEWPMYFRVKGVPASTGL